MTSKKQRKPGSARARDAAKAQKEAERKRCGFDRMKYRGRVGAPPLDLNTAHEWAAHALLAAIEEALNDPGPAPEQSREQIGRLIGSLGRIIDPAKQAEEIREMAKALEDLTNAPPVTQGDQARNKAPTSLS